MNKSYKKVVPVRIGCGTNGKKQNNNLWVTIEEKHLDPSVRSAKMFIQGEDLQIQFCSDPPDSKEWLLVSKQSEGVFRWHTANKKILSRIPMFDPIDIQAEFLGDGVVKLGPVSYFCSLPPVTTPLITLHRRGN